VHPSAVLIPSKNQARECDNARERMRHPLLPVAGSSIAHIACEALALTPIDCAAFRYQSQDWRLVCRTTGARLFLLLARLVPMGLRADFFEELWLKTEAPIVAKSALFSGALETSDQYEVDTSSDFRACKFGSDAILVHAGSIRTEHSRLK